MWILPKPIISAFAPGTEESTWLSSRWCQMAAPLLMWRSKPSPSRTWSQRWKRENWIKHLSGRTLRLSQRKSFTDWWTSSLEATRANRSVPPVSDEEPKTQDIFGHTFDEQFELFSPDESSSKTSKDTSRLDSPRSSAIWTKMVIEQRGEYLVRRNAVRLINANESLSWPTPDASVEKFRLGGNSQQSRSLEAMGRRGELSPQDPVNHSSTGKSQESPGKSPKNWQTFAPGTNGRGGIPHRQVVKALLNNEPVTTQVLTVDQVFAEEIKKKNWPTPLEDDANNVNPSEKRRATLVTHTSKKLGGKLNPNWVEQLMGVPVGWTQLPTEWTDFDSSETELSRLQQQKHGLN